MQVHCFNEGQFYTFRPAEGRHGGQSYLLLLRYVTHLHSQVGETGKRQRNNLQYLETKIQPKIKK